MGNPISSPPLRGRRSSKERGQSFVEFALILPFLLVLVAAVIDLGWMYFTTVSLREAVQEAVTYGSVCPNDTTGIRDRLRSSSTDPVDLSVIPNGDITICVLSGSSTTCPGTPITAAVGRDIRVQTAYTHHIITPFVGAFIGTQDYVITSAARASILRLGYDPLNTFACDH